MAALGYILLPAPAFATTAVALDLPELVKRSARIALVTPTDSAASWELLGAQNRIMTRTQVLVHEIWAEQDGDDDEQGVLISTLGGRVGDLQQKISGEAVLQKGQTCVVFMGPRGPHGRRLMGMAQGHYPLQARGADFVLRRSRYLPAFARRGGARPAVDELEQATLAQARDLIRGAR